MVVLETQLSQLQQLVDKQLTIDKLENTLFTLGFELEEVEGDDIKIDVTPDRLDVLSTQGLARALRAYLSKDLKTPTYERNKSSYKVIVDDSVLSVRPATACAVVKGLKLTDQFIKDIIWVQEKLHATFGRNRARSAIGIYPLEKITWPITFCAKKPKQIHFRPLEAKNPMYGDEILTKHPTGKEYAHLLEGKKVFPLFIDAKDEVLSLPPIINSHALGKVTTQTTDVFIEASGSDFKIQSEVLTLLTTMLAEMGGTIYGVDVVYGEKTEHTPYLAPIEKTITPMYVKEILGVDLPAKEIATLLQRMMYGIVSVKANEVVVTVPPFRLDIWHDIDVVDDVLRAYGINNIELTIPQVATHAMELPENKLQETIRDLLVGLGLNEIKTLAVTDKVQQFDMMGLPQGDHVKLGSVAEKSINMLRSWLLPESLKFLAVNQNRSYPHRIYEVGDVVVPDNSLDVTARNKNHCCICLSDDGVTFTHIKQVVVYLIETLQLPLEIETGHHKSFVPGRCASLRFGKKEIGFFGEVHPSVLETYKLQTPVVAAEFETTVLVK
ncbi:MAG: phenylalanyl-tRNA synthetase beta chain [Candidatus Woesearchaeota archaeon]|jgi:phenylalanyl-tRNA synthetase beta chain